LLDLEQADRALGLAIRGAADEGDILELLDLDGAVDAEIGARTLRQGAIECDLDGDRPGLRRRIGTNDVPFDRAVVVQVDDSALPNGDILGLRLRDAQHGLEATRLRDARELD